ncbi:hypothetical protein [Anoxybacillus sp. P3H1B]|uniref:hypothetical protein n=1 Tax=Anoxybacillus sp. P3H1B TaxID=1769293 RepID=UPI0012E3B694|nr:hypothetical protein [Anoxybacillus sp. P3H1B]
MLMTCLGYSKMFQVLNNELLLNKFICLEVGWFGRPAVKALIYFARVKSLWSGILKEAGEW